MASAREVRDEARRLQLTLTEEQLTWRPDERTWSVAECYEHLRKVDKAYCRRLDEAVERAKRQPGTPFRPTLVGKLYFWGISPTVRFRMPALRGIVPRRVEPGSGREVMTRFLEQQKRLINLIRRADRRDINTGRFASPLFGLIRVSTGEALTLLVLHEQRHAAQARRLTDRPDFPAGGAP